MTKYEYMVIFIWKDRSTVTSTGTSQTFYKCEQPISREEHVKHVEADIKQKCDWCTDLFISSFQLLRTYEDDSEE